MNKTQLLSAAFLSVGLVTTQAANLLTNSSFEVITPAPGYGNNFSPVVTDWTMVSVPGSSINVVNPLGSYADGPNNAQDGALYLDIADGAGYYQQSFTLSTLSTLEISGYFSRRNAPGGGSVSIYSADNMTLLFQSTPAFNTLAVTEEVWTLSTGNSLTAAGGPVTFAAGTYVFRFSIDDSGNGDSAFLEATPFTPIPEPSVAILGVIGFLSIARRRR